MRRRFSRSQRGVSEVIGALLLTLVVIIAVASFAVFVSVTQTNAQNRSNYISNVQNENLQVTSIAPEPNNASIQYQATNSTNKYYIEIETPKTVTIVSNAGTFPASLSACTMDLNPCPPADQEPAEYNWINTTTSAYFALGSPNELVFAPAGGVSNLSFQIATWQNLTMTIRNLNTAQSGLSGVSVNGHYLLSWELLNQTGSVVSVYGTSPPLVIGAKTSVSINVNLTGFNIPKTTAISILLLTSAYNFFNALFSPPSSIVTQSITSENYLVASRDVPLFTGSASNASKPYSIMNYFWELDVPNSTWQQGNWGDVANIQLVFAYGQSFQYRPEAFFSSFKNLSVSGPLTVTLTTVDSNGLMAISQVSELPSDPNIAPAGTLSGVAGTCAGNQTVTVTVDNIFGQPLQGAPLLFLPGNQGFTVSPSFAVTNSSGIATTTVIGCTGSQELGISSGNLPPIYVQV